MIYTDPSFLISGENYKTNILIGGGIEYYTFLRHYSLYFKGIYHICLLYTSDAADERSSVDLGGRRIIKKKNTYTSREQDSLKKERK